MGDCRAHILKLDDVYVLLKGAANSMGTGISSIEIEGTGFKITCTDGRELYVEYPTLPPGNKVTDMRLSYNKKSLVLTQLVNGVRKKFEVPLEEFGGIEDVIDAKCTVGGVRQGKHYPKGYSLESIVRQILSGKPIPPDVELTTTDTRITEDKEILLDKSTEETLGSLKLYATVKVEPENQTLEDFWWSAPEWEQHELINDPEQKEFFFTTIHDFDDLTYADNPDGYTISANAVDQYMHVGMDHIGVRWIYPIYIGVYNGKYILPGLKNTKFLKEDYWKYEGKDKFIPVEDLDPMQRIACCDSEFLKGIYAEHNMENLMANVEYPNLDYNPVSDPNNDPVKNPDYAIEPYYDPTSEDFDPEYNSAENPRTFKLFDHVVADKLDFTYTFVDDIYGKAFMIYKVEYGMADVVSHTGVNRMKNWHMVSDHLEHYDDTNWFLYVDDLDRQYISGDYYTVQEKYIGGHPYPENEIRHLD